MQQMLLALHVLIGIALIGLILIQHGKGADTGAAFGSGASTTVFGARGSASFLTRATAVLAILFFSNSFLLAYLSSRQVEEKSLMERVQSQSVEEPAKRAETDLPQQPKPDSDLPAVPEDPQ